jgi:hypothetical protein
MSKGDSFKIISVTGAHSKVGKTTLCSIILNKFKGLGAIKFTKTSLYTSITDNPNIINQKDKDTAIMSEAGAERVVWIQSPSQGLKEALNIALDKMSGLKGVVIEGNSPVYFLDPHLIIFIVGQDYQIKTSAVRICRKANIIIVNTPPASLQEKKLKKEYFRIKNHSFLHSLLQENTETFWINLIKKQGEIDKFLDHVKKYIQI